jgi:hypothetical protein
LFQNQHWGYSLKSKNKLFISDPHLPYEHLNALRFYQYLVDKYSIALDDIYCVGDFADLYFMGLYPKGPDMPHTPNQEIECLRKQASEWYKSFPRMKIAHSNHEYRYFKKMSASEIPSQLLRSWSEFLGAPKGWEWKEHWIIKGKKDVLMTHGEEFGGAAPHLNHAINYGINTVIGHWHGIAGTEYRKTRHTELWGLATGCSIKADEYAFAYGNKFQKKPIIGGGVVCDDGRLPIFEPMF